MYRIIDDRGMTIAIVSRLEDAKALVHTQLDPIKYKIIVDKPKS